MDVKDFKIHLVDKTFVSPLFESVIKEDLKDLTVNENEVKLHTFYIEDKGEDLEVSACIINALPRQIDFRDITVAIIDTDNNILGHQSLDLVHIGILPSNSVTPLNLSLVKVNFNLDYSKISSYRLAFLNNLKAATSTKITKIIIDENFDPTEARVLERLIDEQTTIETNKVVLQVLDPKIKESTLYVPLVVLNNAPKQLTTVDINIGLMDALGRLKAKKNINGLSLSVQPQCAYVAKVIFTEDDIYEDIESLVDYKAVIFNK